jgi:hypothetical protein
MSWSLKGTGWNMPLKRTGSPDYEGKTGLSTSEFSWAA